VREGGLKQSFFERGGVEKEGRGGAITRDGPMPVDQIHNPLKSQPVVLFEAVLVNGTMRKKGGAQKKKTSCPATGQTQRATCQGQERWLLFWPQAPFIYARGGRTTARKKRGEITQRRDGTTEGDSRT